MPAPQYFILRLSFKVCYSLQVWNHLFFFIFSPAAQTPKTASHAKPNHAVALIRGTRPEMSSPTVTSIFGWPLISTSFRVCSKSQTSFRAQPISFRMNSRRSCLCSSSLSRRSGFDDSTCFFPFLFFFFKKIPSTFWGCSSSYFTSPARQFNTSKPVNCIQPLQLPPFGFHELRLLFRSVGYDLAPICAMHWFHQMKYSSTASYNFLSTFSLSRPSSHPRFNWTRRHIMQQSIRVKRIGEHPPAACDNSIPADCAADGLSVETPDTTVLPYLCRTVLWWE